jgi:hypothetical protein
VTTERLSSIRQEAALLRLRKSYFYACHTNKALGFLFASFLLLSNVNTARLSASVCDDCIEPHNSLSSATDSLAQNIETGSHAPEQMTLAATYGPQHELLLTAASILSRSVNIDDGKIVIFAPSDKVATFNVTLRQSRDPPIFVG